LGEGSVADDSLELDREKLAEGALTSTAVVAAFDPCVKLLWAVKRQSGWFLSR
jgi:hypothetical protein